MISTTRLPRSGQQLDDPGFRGGREGHAIASPPPMIVLASDNGVATDRLADRRSRDDLLAGRALSATTDRLARRLKVTFDWAAAASALVVLAPLLGLVAVAVMCDGGPAFYAHTRIGRDGRKFGCLKFRSMVRDSNAVLHALLQNDAAAAAEWKATHKLRQDPRITRVGRLLRASSLDELPQLLNVLRLEMSLVGPRPIVAEEVPRYGPNIAYYYAGRPGLTGLWQISGRSDTSYAQRVALDSEYVSTWSMWRDFSIIARTIPAVLRGRGAR